MIPDLPATVWLRIATFLVPDELDEVGERVGRKARARQSQLTALLSLSKVGGDLSRNITWYLWIVTAYEKASAADK